VHVNDAHHMEVVHHCCRGIVVDPKNWTGA
jgi:hypothetical protein